MSEHPRCAARSEASNAPCRWRAVDGSLFCPKHDPALEEARRTQMSERGSESQLVQRERAAEEVGEPVPLGSPEVVRRWLEELGGWVRCSKGEITSRVGAGVKVAQQAIAAIQLDLERKARELAEERARLESDRAEFEAERRAFESRARAGMTQ